MTTGAPHGGLRASLGHSPLYPSTITWLVYQESEEDDLPERVSLSDRLRSWFWGTLLVAAISAFWGVICYHILKDIGLL